MGRLLNATDPDVARSLASRVWPSSVSEYSEMMAEDAALRVAFTSKGDQDVVKFLVLGW
jgi:hypothetical protein